MLGSVFCPAAAPSPGRVLGPLCSKVTAVDSPDGRSIERVKVPSGVVAGIGISMKFWSRLIEVTAPPGVFARGGDMLNRAASGLLGFTDPWKLRSSNR